MGHNIEHRTVSVKANLKKVEQEINAYVRQATWQEGGSGLDSPIRWLDVTCDNYEEAEAYIKKADKGWYDQLAVKYYDLPKTPTSAKLQELESRKRKCEFAYQEKRNKLHYADVKSEYISCKQCGSRLARKYINTNRCPLCGVDLRPASTLEGIEKAKIAMEKAIAAYKAELRKLELQNRKNAKVMWLIKFEYHT